MKRMVKSGLVAASLGLLGGAGCGPAPWYDPHHRPYVEPSEDEDGPGEFYEGATGPEPLRIVHTHRRDAYYVIDPNRRLCFFHQGKAMSPVDCALLPEARDIAQASDEAARTAASSRRYEEEGYDDYDDEVEPDPSEGDPVEPEPEPVGDVEPDTPAPPPAPVPIEAPKPADLGPHPDDDERRRFTLAYIAIYCDGRKAGQVEPAKRIAEVGLTPERYSQVEGWVASDEKAWRSLTLAARAACPD